MKLFNVSIIIISRSLFVILIVIFLFNSCEKDWGKLGNGYYLEYNAIDDLSLLGKNRNYLVYGPIIKYQYNFKYITIMEKPREKIYVMYNLDSMYDQENKRRYRFDKINYFNYWIIDKQLDSVFGPYQKNEFLVKFNELKLPDSLKVE